MSFGARTSRGEESNTKSILPYMGKTVVGTVGKHGRETGRNRVDGRGYLPNPGGTVPAARGWRSADAPPCPVATAPGLGHAPGSGNRGGRLPHRATVGRLVPAGRGGRSVRPSWGRAWSTLLAHPRAGSSSGRGSSPGDLHHGSGRPAVGGPAVQGHLPAQGDLWAAPPGALPAQSPPTHPHQGRPRGPGSLEKRGRAAALRAAGITTGDHLAWANEMRVWAPVGVKVRQQEQKVREWRYLVVAIEVLAGRLWWCWRDTIRSEEIAGVVRGWQQNTDLEAVVWDGASSHRSAVVQAVGFPLVQQPAYAPELDPVERLFEELRRVVEGKVYDALEAKGQPLRQNSASGMPTPTGCAAWWAGHGSWTPSTNSLVPGHLRHNHIELL